MAGPPEGGGWTQPAGKAVSGPHETVSSEHPRANVHTRGALPPAHGLGSKPFPGQRSGRAEPLRPHLATFQATPPWHQSWFRVWGGPRVRKCLYPFLPDTLKPPLTVAGKNLRKPHTRQEGQTDAVSCPRAPLARPAAPGLRLRHHRKAPPSSGERGRFPHPPYRRGAGGRVHKPAK